MTFYMREYSSEEKYDLSKFLNFEEGVYDVINSPFLAQLKQLPTTAYYDVNKGFKEIDMIADHAYGDMFLAYLIQYYNNDFRDTFPEGTKLSLFSLEELETLYYNMTTNSNTGER